MCAIFAANDGDRKRGAYGESPDDRRERFNVAVLRSRVGYVLDRIGLSHPNLETWRASSRRGGSSRLVGSEPFARTFDERWNLSINGPVGVLDERAT